MRLITKLVAATAFVALAACSGKNNANNAAENVTETNAMTETTTVNETTTGGEMNATGNSNLNATSNTYANATTNNAM